MKKSGTDEMHGVSSKSKSSNEPSQAQTANDVCKCRGCGVPNAISIVPDLKTNKWKCINCNLIQVWQPSSTFAQVHDTVTKVRATKGQPISLFSITPLAGIGADGCLSGVYTDPSHLTNIFIVSGFLAFAAIIIEHYRSIIASRDAMYHTEPIEVHASNYRVTQVATPGDDISKAPNKVSGVDNWNRQPPISILSQSKEVSAMSKAQSIARVKKQSGISFRSLPCSIHNSTNNQS